MSETASSGSARRAELLLGPNATAGKEVYEYTPDPGSVISHESSAQEAYDRDAYRASRSAKDVDEAEISPSTAYEFFRGKTYKSTVFQGGFSARRGFAGSQTGMMEVRGDRAISSAFRSSRASNFGSLSSLVSDFPQGTSFETPIGRLKRLQGEVEEMLDFVSSFLVEEQVVPPDQADTTGALKQPPEGEGQDGAEPFKQSGTVQVQYQTRRLPPGAQDALFFGHDPLSLIEELKRLRMQVASVLSDRRTEALVSHIEPVTGMRSGVSLLAQHLSAASAQLQQTLASQETAAAPSASTPTTGRPPSSASDSKTNETSPRDDGAMSPTTAYELYCVPSLTPMIEQSRMTSLERRLAMVEGKMGLHKMSLLPHADLFEAVNEMQQRIKLLDAQKIETLQKRVQSLLLELHALQQRRHELDLAAEAPTTSGPAGSLVAGGGARRGNPSAPASCDWQRVEELYEICERWKAPAAVLPSVLERLKLLKGVHQEAGGMAVRLSVLEKQQEELQAWVKGADEAVNQLQKTVLDSIGWAQKTVSQMQQRLVAVEASSPAAGK